VILIGRKLQAADTSSLPSAVEEEPGPGRHLSLVERSAATVDVRVIASLNCVTPGRWSDYARAMQSAGAAAIELNIYYVSGDPTIPGRDVEQRYVDVLEHVKNAVTVPVAVKLGPYFSSAGLAAYRTAAAGRNWDPSAGTTTLDGPTVDACARVGGLIYQAGASNFEHGIQPGPVFHFDGGAIGLDLRFGDPDADGRAVEAIAEGFATLGCTLGGEGGAPIISGGS